MLISIMLFVVPLLYMAARVLWAVFFRKLHKTKFRFFGVLVSFALALLATYLTKSVLDSDSFATGTLIPLLFDGNPTFSEFFMSLPTLRETLSGIVASLVAPLLFLVYFMVFDLISWIVFLIVSLVRKKTGKLPEEKGTPASVIATVAMALGNALVVVLVWMIPIGTYANFVPAALSCFTETDILKPDEKAVYEEIVTDYVTPIDENLLVNTFRFLGGSVISDIMTTFDVNDTYVGLTKEADAISEFGGNLIGLSQTYYDEYGEREMELFDHLSESVHSSKTLSPILSEAVHAATDAWLAGDDFLNISLADLYIDERGIFDGFIDQSVHILNEDTKNGNINLIRNDLDTTFEMLKVLIRHGVFANSDMDDDLLGRLAKDGTVRELITVLEGNQSMSALIPEVTNIGMSAIGSTLGIPADGESDYDEMMEVIAGELNGIKRMDEEAQLACTEELLRTEFAKEGLIVEESVVSQYAVLLVDDLVRRDGDEPIDSADLLVFFSENSFESSQDTAE
ncbi:MAG: hypothetical protein E7643_03735 [Ruminococcaceae bacterium]|nr:hypothetical protein [Oscillospiraceae bacterium]